MHSVVQHLKAQRIRFEPGLSHDEIRAIESALGRQLPQDLLRFLRGGLPVSPGFFPWRTLVQQSQPISFEEDLHRGILHDAEHNGLWLDRWGPARGSIGEARSLLGAAPMLLPIRFRHYLPALPGEGWPVLSVRQSDVRVVAHNLDEYLYTLPDPDAPALPIEEAKEVPFWTDAGRMQHSLESCARVWPLRTIGENDSP